MQKSNLQNQSESKWKQKYFDNLDRTEVLEKKLRSRIEMLSTGLTDVCSFGDELNPRLNKEWAALRRVTKKAGNETSLLQPLRNLTKALQDQTSKVHSARKRSSGALIEAIDQLLVLDPPVAQNKKLRKLKRTLAGKKLDEIDLADQIKKYAQQLRETLVQLKFDNSQNKTSRLTRLFRRSEKTKDQPISSGENETCTDEIASDNHFVRNQSQDNETLREDSHAAPQPYAQKISEALRYLLDQLDIPKPLTDSAKQLESRLEQNIDWKDLEDVLMPTIELSLASVDWHYSQFGDFLEQINSQLDAVQSFLHASQDLRTKQTNNKNKLNMSVAKVVTDIEQSIENSNSLDFLKETINLKMQSIVGALHEFEESEKTREAELMGELQILGGKLHQLEAQSQTMRAKLESQKQLARQDNVTQLPNRSAYDERLQFEYSRWQRYENSLSIIVGDIDHFKKFNDDYGHLAGDAVLKLVAQTLKKNLRETDFIARFGGEEFAVLLPNTKRAQAEKVAEKLRQSIASSQYTRRGTAIKITISFGISELVKGDSKETLFERADKALYYAKNQGRNRCCSA